MWMIDPLAAVRSKSVFSWFPVKSVCGMTDRSAPVSMRKVCLELKSFMNNRRGWLTCGCAVSATGCISLKDLNHLGLV